MQIAVTGATGFLGRHVVPALIEQDIEVSAVVRTEVDEKPWLNGLNKITLDLASPPEEPFEYLGRPDAVIHLAWQGLREYTSLHHFETELPIQFNFLKALVEGGLPRLLVTGTCFEYGMQSGPLHESLPTKPTNPYGFAKDSLRRQLAYLKSEYPFEFIWARLFYMYGEGQASNSLLPQLKQAIATSASSFNMSGGEQLRDYLPIKEIARILVALAREKSDPGVVNVCSGEPISVRSLVEGWLAEINSNITLNLGHYPYPDYEPMAFWGERNKLNALLGNTECS